MEAALTLHPHLSSTLSSSLHHQNPVKEPHCLTRSVCGLTLFSLWFSPSCSFSLSCSHFLGPHECSFISTPCGVLDYNVTHSFLGVPISMPGDKPSTLYLPCHYPSTPKPNTGSCEVLSCLSLSLCWLWILIRESLSLREQHARAICFPLAKSKAEFSKQNMITKGRSAHRI